MLASFLFYGLGRQDASATPTDGKFFYLQLNPETSNGYHGMHYTEFMVGS
jgi:hypothetical protein